MSVGLQGGVISRGGISRGGISRGGSIVGGVNSRGGIRKPLVLSRNMVRATAITVGFFNELHKLLSMGIIQS